MKKLVVREIKIFFLLFFLYINKNFSCDCCDECCKKIFPDKKTSSKYSGKNKKSDIPSIIDEEQEEEENEEEENEEEENSHSKKHSSKYLNKKKYDDLSIIEEENKEEQEENEDENEEEEKKEEDEEEKALNKYLQSVFCNFRKNIKTIEGDFFKAQKTYVLETSGTKKNDGILGEGGFGRVYKIKNKKNDKTFVLKQSVVKEKDLKDIKNEIRNLIRFRNEENILRIVDVYRQDNFVGKFFKKKYSKKDNVFCFYIITEYCKNGDLYDFIEHENIPNKELLRDKIAYQIINAVYVCHQKQIAHRDLKPENFFLDENYNVKLGDFGFSKKFKRIKKDSEIVYTENFACYEILLEKKHDPFKADLFSLGVTLFVLYTGENLLDVKTKMGKEIIIEKFNAIPTTIDKYIREDPNLNDLLKKLLERKEKDRCGWKEIFESEFYKS